jgi:hypothetical protein
MKHFVTLSLFCLSSISVQAQGSYTTGARGQYGTGGAYVAPPVIHNYTPPPAPRSVPTPSSYGSSPSYRSSPSSGSYNSTPAPRSSYSSSPSSGTPKPSGADVPVNYARREKTAEEVEQGKLYGLRDQCRSSYTSLPELYDAFCIRKKGYQLMFFGNPTTDLENLDYYVVRSCIYMEDYERSIEYLRNHKMLGRTKKSIYKKGDYYDEVVKMTYYVNYMTGRCFQELNMADSAKKYLKLGEGFEEEWNKLYAGGVEYRKQK